MLPERTTQAYGPAVTTASKAVLLELMATLRAYREALVLVGGWAPYFLLERHRRPEDAFAHVGSIDIDLVVDPVAVREPEYASIVELLTARGYRPVSNRRGGSIPQSLERVISSPVTNKPYTIRVDFLTQHDNEAVRGTRLQVQDDLFARKLKGCGTALQHCTTIELSGTLPDGGELTVPMRMADIVSCLTMKGIVLGERYREKDAYDIFALLAHYGHGPKDVAAALQPHLGEPLVREAMIRIRTAFGTRTANGPAWVAAFLVSPLFAAERERAITDAFMVVSEFSKFLFAGSDPNRVISSISELRV
ncbi:MAG: hypothetical protein HY352_00365 [Candidatus Omnitrophica bacterium]|nr:hypothetical protein [Candidatus Omnitrophota bacterium]